MIAHIVSGISYILAPVRECPFRLSNQWLDSDLGDDSLVAVYCNAPGDNLRDILEHTEWLTVEDVAKVEQCGVKKVGDLLRDNAYGPIGTRLKPELVIDQTPHALQRSYRFHRSLFLPYLPSRREEPKQKTVARKSASRMNPIRFSEMTDEQKKLK